MSSGHREVAGAEALVGGLLSLGFATVARGMSRASSIAAADDAHIRYLRSVDANARAIVRRNTAARMGGSAALLAAYNRRVAAGA